jgi:hypothetical protein
MSRAALPDFHGDGRRHGPQSAARSAHDPVRFTGTRAPGVKLGPATTLRGVVAERSFWRVMTALVTSLKVNASPSACRVVHQPSRIRYGNCGRTRVA